MVDWKNKLYSSYVSTEQSSASSLEKMRLNHDSYPQFRDIIRKYVPSDKSIRIADLGCGYGSLVHCLKVAGYINVQGVDVSAEQVQLASQLGLSEVRQGDLHEFLSDKGRSYDIIFLMDVLEHLDKQEVIDLLECARNALTDRGRMIVHVPNGEGIFGMRIRYGDFTHQVCFTPKSIRQVLRAAGFKTISVHEDKPLVHGMKSFVRRVLWSVLTVRERLLLLAETGASGHVLSQNMLVIADVG